MPWGVSWSIGTQDTPEGTTRWPHTSTEDATMAKPNNSRTARWAAACQDARAAMEAVQDAAQAAADSLEALRDIQGEYQDWYDGLPDVSQGTAMAEKLEAVTGLDLDWEADPADLDSLEAILDEAEGADLPLGFGRD